MAGADDRLRVLGADANNLRNVDLDFPFGSLTVVTGVSGSGKSSLLAQTLAAEGARRNATFLGLSQPELEEDEPRAFIGPMPPTALVGQRGFRPSIRTTVATATGLLALLRRLFMIEAVVRSDATGQPVPPPSPETYSRWLARYYRGDLELLAAPLRMQKSDGVAAVRRLAAHGVKTVRVYSETDSAKLQGVGREVALGAFKPLNPSTAHSVEASFGRHRVTGPDSEPALRSSLENAFAAGGGAVVVTLASSDDLALAGPFGPRLDSLRNWVHPEDPATYLPPSRHLLSFNAPSHADSGACPTCAGTGVARRVDLDALIAHPERSMAQGAFSLWTAKNYKHLNIQHETIAGLAGLKGFDPERPWRELPAAAQDLVLNGSHGLAIEDRDATGRKIGAGRPFRGFAPILLEKAAGGNRTAQPLSEIVVSGRCPACDGARWSPQARALRVAGLGIGELLGNSFAELANLWRADGPFAVVRSPEARGLVAAARKRTEDVVQVGLSYLTADRGMLEVSDGESRRLRLARVLAPDQSGFCLLLDEPGRGLHEADLGRLGEALGRLRGRHTVILNEHRKSLWPVADRLIEFGPGAGPSGGQIVQDGRPPVAETDSRPFRALLPPPGSEKAWLRIGGIRHHNIHDAEVAIPSGRLTTICGVSGSGKSSFVHGVLIPALTGTPGSQGRWRSLAGQSHLGDLVVLDQAVPSPNRRSLVATLSGSFDSVRKAFAASEPARRDGLGPSDFGLNAGHGRCPVCEGIGSVDAEGRAAPCPACGGARYGPAVLSVRVHGMNIGELLETPVDRLPPELRRLAKADELLDLMGDLGIGHVALGRRIDTLSGGELQRLRLAVRLATSRACSTFVMDEPAAGLNERDVQTLIGALDRVLDGGRNTIIVVEHDLEIIRASDWLVEFGPGSGPQGGDVVFEGLVSDLPARTTPTALALSGRLVPIKPVPPASKPMRPIKLNASEGAEQARRTLAALRTVTTGDVPAAEDYDPAEDAPRPPTVRMSDRLWSGRDPSEAAGLEREVAKVLLDLHHREREDAGYLFLEAWAVHPDASPRIHPFVEEMRTWGARLPQAVIRDRLNHLRAEGLAVSNKTILPLDGQDVRHARATGPRFAPAATHPGARLSVLADALVIGGGYVELCAPDGTVKATAGHRLVSPAKGLVAPLAPMPRDFSRHEASGRCPACKGSRLTPALDDDLLIARPNMPPSEEGFLTPPADKVLKSVRRSMLLPYLKKLASEGLWELEKPFAAFDDDDRGVLVNGDWRRPGHGTFLKTPKSNPSEVSSWLRWNGLYREILDQADRSTDKAWLNRLRSSCRMIECKTCGGSGLRVFAQLLPAGKLDFRDWSLSAPARQVDSLQRCNTASSPRAAAGLGRILACLDPKSHAQLDTETVAHRMIGTFTTLTAVEPTLLETD